MKKLLCVLICAIVTLSLGAQSLSEERYDYIKSVTDSSSVDSVIKEVLWNTETLNAIESRLIRLEDIVRPRFKVYKTQNMWTFLELDTEFGQIYKLQWSVDSKKSERFKRSIGSVTDWSESAGRFFPGRFELYETTNIYNFILVDSATGKTWQVQWGMNRDEDGIWPIE